jgi:hypothetical protein
MNVACVLRQSFLQLVSESRSDFQIVKRRLTTGIRAENASFGDFVFV